jgi:hypothetical protein
VPKEWAKGKVEGGFAPRPSTNSPVHKKEWLLCPICSDYTPFYSIFILFYLFYSIFYFILFYLFYSIFYFILFYFILFYLASEQIKSNRIESNKIQIEWNGIKYKWNGIKLNRHRSLAPIVVMLSTPANTNLLGSSPTWA